MSQSTQPPALLLSSNIPNFKEGNTSSDKSHESFYPNGKIPCKQRIPMSPQDNSPLINGQHELSNISSSTGSLQTPQYEYEDLPTWTVLPGTVPSNEGNINSPTSDSYYERDELEANNNSDIDEGPHKRQKTQMELSAQNGQIEISNVLLVKSLDKRPALKPRFPRQQNIPTPLAPVGSSDNEIFLPVLSIEDTKSVESKSTTSANPSPSPTAVTGSKPALGQGSSVKEEKESSVSTQSRKRKNGLNGLLVPRPSATSNSTSSSDFPNSEAFKDHEEPPRKTRGLGLRPTDPSYGVKSKKSQGRIADQSELELWTNADVAHVRFRKPDELRVLHEVEEENVKRSVGHLLTSLMEMEEDGPGNEGTRSNGAQNQVAIPDSSIYTRCDDLVEEIFGPDSGNRGMSVYKPRMALNALNRHRPSIDSDGDKEDEETTHDTKSVQVPLPQLEDWSITLRSLIKGKKKFQYQDLINLKNTLQEIYNNRANISADSSLAQEVHKLSQLGAHDVPNRDELNLRVLARQSIRYWGIKRQRDT